MFTILPSRPRSSSTRPTARQTRKVLRRFAESTRSKSSTAFTRLLRDIPARGHGLFDLPVSPRPGARTRRTRAPRFLPRLSWPRIHETCVRMHGDRSTDAPLRQAETVVSRATVCNGAEKGVTIARGRAWRQVDWSGGHGSRQRRPSRAGPGTSRRRCPDRDFLASRHGTCGACRPLRASRGGAMSERYFGSWQRRVVFAGAVTVVAAAAFAAAVATHTGKAAGVRAGVDNSTLVYAITDTPPDIDPNSSAEFVESELFTNTLSRLFDYKTVKRSDGTYVMQSAGYQPVVGSLVTTWTVSPDKKTITVNLRTGVKNYLGDTFDAKDVVYTFDRLLALKGTGTFYESSIGITKPSNIKVVDPHKIVFKLDFPAELFFKMMSIPHMGIVDSVEFKKHATKSDPWAAQWAHTHSVGFGPYYITQNQQ